MSHDLGRVYFHTEGRVEILEDQEDISLLPQSLDQ